jgi:hypothetical protein
MRWQQLHWRRLWVVQAACRCARLARAWSAPALAWPPVSRAVATSALPAPHHRLAGQLATRSAVPHRAGGFAPAQVYLWLRQELVSLLGGDSAARVAFSGVETGLQVEALIRAPRSSDAPYVSGVREGQLPPGGFARWSRRMVALHSSLNPACCAPPPPTSQVIPACTHRPSVPPPPPCPHTDKPPAGMSIPQAWRAVLWVGRAPALSPSTLPARRCS